MRLNWERDLGGYWRPSVEPDEVRVDSGKTVPYPFSLGTIKVRGGKIKVAQWSPAAHQPRGTSAAIKRELEHALVTLARDHRASTPDEAVALEEFRRAFGGPARGHR